RFVAGTVRSSRSARPPVPRPFARPPSSLFWLCELTLPRIILRHAEGEVTRSPARHRPEGGITMTSVSTYDDLDRRVAGGLGVAVIATSSLSDSSYLATDGETALVVDPQRDVDRFLGAAGRLGVGVALVVETHVHNDYVSGGLELARL